MKDVSSIPGLKSALNKDRDLKKLNKILGTKISLPGGSNRVEVKLQNLTGTIKSLENLKKTANREISKRESQILQIYALIDIARAQGSQAEVARLNKQVGELQQQVGEYVQPIRKANDAIKILERAKKKIKNIVLLGAIKATGVGGVLTKIPGVERLILNYGMTVVKVLAFLSLIIIMFLCIILSQLASGNITTQLQTATDAAGNCSLSDQKCIGELYVQNIVENGTANVQ